MLIKLENPKFDRLILSLLKKRIETNVAEERDYELLQSFLTSTGMETAYLLNLLRNAKIEGFKEYVSVCKKPMEQGNIATKHILRGQMLGAVTYLERHLERHIEIQLYEVKTTEPAAGRRNI